MFNLAKIIIKNSGLNNLYYKKFCCVTVIYMSYIMPNSDISTLKIKLRMQINKKLCWPKSYSNPNLVKVDFNSKI